MTSQKSLKNNVNFKDFLRSLREAAIPSVLAFFVLFFAVAYPVINYIGTKTFKQEIEHKRVLMFLGDYTIFAEEPNLLTFGMFGLGVLTAFLLFTFLTRKNQVNVYLSLGITRTRLFINRICASALAFFLVSFIPTTVSLFINIASFGLSKQLISVYFYLSFLFFVTAMAGLAIGSFAAMIAGNVIETGLTVFSVSVTPSILYSAFETAKYYMLRGYSQDTLETSHRNILIPFTFGYDMNAELAADGSNSSVFYNPIGAVAGVLDRDLPASKYKVPSELIIDRGFIIPIVVWVVISVVLIVLAGVLINRRKAENSNSLGKFGTANFINSLFAVSIATVAMADSLGYDYSEVPSSFLYNNIVILILIYLAVTLIVYFLVQLILRRKIKGTLKSLTFYPLICCTGILCIFTLATGYFGQYNKLPEVSQIKSIAVADNNLNGIFYNSVSPYFTVTEAADTADKELVAELFEMVSKNENSEKSDLVSTVYFKIVDKDSNVEYRRFKVFNNETYYNFLEKFMDSAYFDKILENNLLKSKSSDASDEQINYYGVMYDKYSPVYSDSFWYYTDSSLLFEGNPDEGDNIISEPAELCKHLYNDLKDMTFKDIMLNPKQPLGILTTSYPEPKESGNDILDKSAYAMYYYGDYYYDGSNGDGDEDKTGIYFLPSYTSIQLYPQMKETVSYLESIGMIKKTFNKNVKEVFVTDSKLSASKAVDLFINIKNNRSMYGYSMYAYSETVFKCDDPISYVKNIQPYIDVKMTAYEGLLNMYTECGHPLEKITDAQRIEKVISNSVPFYLNAADNGRYAYVVYEDNTVTYFYIPEVNLSNVK